MMFKKKKVQVKPLYPPVPLIPPRPKICITFSAKARMDAYIKVAGGEISGLGTVSIPEPNVFLIEEIFLLKQKNTYVTTDLNTAAQAEFIREWLQQGRNISTIRLWWHSHASGNTFWSSPDCQTIESFGGSDWMVSVVSNKRGDILARLDLYHPIRVVIDNLPFETLQSEDPVLMEEVKREVAAKVKFAKPVYTASTYTYQPFTPLPPASPMDQGGEDALV
jgi:proteasome lid subunit RPN8/RPN11